jgi:hypothetical protein
MAAANTITSQTNILIPPRSWINGSFICSPDSSGCPLMNVPNPDRIGLILEEIKIDANSFSSKILHRNKSVDSWNWNWKFQDLPCDVSTFSINMNYESNVPISFLVAESANCPTDWFQSPLIYIQELSTLSSFKIQKYAAYVSKESSYDSNLLCWAFRNDNMTYTASVNFVLELCCNSGCKITQNSAIHIFNPIASITVSMFFLFLLGIFNM